MSWKWGKSAWYICNNIFIPSETKRNAFYSIFNKFSKKDDRYSFYQWLVGVVDGDGTFHFQKTRDNYWIFYFKVGQSNYNLRLLYHIKKILGYGSVSVPQSKDNIAEFRIRDRKVIIKVILPIFDKYPLLTSKQFNYEIFRKAIIIMEDPSLTSEIKNINILKLKSIIRPDNYISPVFRNILNISKENVEDIISKQWLIGFTEAEGSFYITKKGSNRIQHIFEITQKIDRIVLEAISVILDIKVKTKNTYFTVLTTNLRSLSLVDKYFFNEIKGIKAVEYRIWSRSRNKNYTYVELLKVQEQMRSLRTIRNKSFNIE